MSRRRTDILPDTVWGTWRVIAEARQRSRGVRRFRVECIACAARADKSLSGLLNSVERGDQGCRACFRERQIVVRLIMPDGSLVAPAALVDRYSRITLVVAEVRDAQERPRRKSEGHQRLMRRPTDLPVVDRARSLLADGWAEAAVAEALEMRPDELRALLRA